jgi:hypothetical protein
VHHPLSSFFLPSAPFLALWFRIVTFLLQIVGNVAARTLTGTGGGEVHTPTCPN